MRKSFTWFLSLMVLLFAFATHGYAQEEQETVELYAENASSCYLEANDYTVAISVRDFIKLTRFELGLSFNDQIYTFTGVSGVNTGLAALTTSVTPVALGPDVLNLNWTGGPVTIGDDAKTDVINLHFELKGFPANTAVTFPTDLIWTKTDFWYTIPGPIYDAVNTVKDFDGSLAVDVAVNGIETELSMETCAGGDVMVTVTAPDAAWYLFNEDPIVADWDWQTSNEFLAKAGERVTIRVKDAEGCISLMDEVIIPETVDPLEFTVTPQDVLCYGEKGRITINATGGIAPYTYWISENPDGSDAEEKTNFQFSYDTGTYYVSVTDANGCDVVDPWKEVTIVDENDPVVITPTITDVLCYGESTGAIAVTVSGGATEVSIDGNTWETLVVDAYTFDELSAGTYTVWAKNENGCVVELKDVVVGQPDGAITFDIEIEDTSCGGTNDGVITVVDVAGGTAPYEYSTDGGETWQASNVFSGLEPIYYSLWVMDANGCVVAYDNPNGTGNKIAVQSPTDINYDVVVTDPICNDGPASVAIANVSGGTGSYIYTFDDGTTWVDTMTIDVWNAPYTLPGIWVANADTTCLVPYGTEWGVDNPAVLVAEVADTLAPTCIDSRDGDIQLHITGGVAPYWYSLNGGAWKESDGAYTSLKVPVGTHEINVKDSKGCEIDVPLIQPITLQENLIEATSDLLIECYGDKVGTISVAINDWAEMGTYERSKQWMIENADGAVTAFTPSNVGEATLFNAGTYIVWGVDQYTCVSNKDTVVVRENPELIIDDVVATGASCFDVANGVINIYARGGTVDGVLEYAWVDNDPAKLDNLTEDKWLDFDTYDPLTTTSRVKFNVNGGTYWVAVRDNNCAEVTYGPIEVDGYEKLLVDETMVTFADPLCFESMTGTITVPMGAVTGGAGAYLFTLLDMDGEPVEDYIDLATGEFTGLGAGTYSVLVEDTEDCPSYTTMEMVLEDPALLTFDTRYWHMTCLNENDGVIEITANGGTPGYEYAINNTREKDWIAFKDDSNVKTYIATEVGTYTIWVRDANGCVTDSTEVTIEAPEELGADITVTNVSCYGGSDGEIDLVGTGGWGSAMSTYQFKVNNGSWTSATTISGLPQGNHTLYVRDVTVYTEPYQALDCVYEVPFEINQPMPITYDVMIQDVKCKDGADGMLTVDVLSGGTPWDLIDTVNDGYDVKITGDDYDSGWIRTGADYTHTFMDLAHSHYTVYIQDARGCTLMPTIGNDVAPYITIESWEVNEPETYLTLDPQWLNDVTCYGGNDGSFELNATGGTGSYTYHTELSELPSGHYLVEPEEGAEWQTSNTFNVGVGTWVVWVKDANGCIVGGERDDNNMPVNKWRVKVGEPDSIVWDFHTVMGEGDVPVKHYKQPSCYGSWDGQIHLVDIMGGSGTYNAHVWGTSAAGETVDTTYTDIEMIDGAPYIYILGGVPASDIEGFNVTVMDHNGCTSAVDTIRVDQPEELMVSLEESKGSFTCYQDNEGWIEATVTGGTELEVTGNDQPYEFKLWRDGVVHTKWQNIASAFLVEVGHEFVVEVRDANGCTTSDTIYIETPQPVAFTSVDMSCKDDVKATVEITATGTPGRTFTAWYREIGEAITNPGPFIQHNGTFTESIVISDVFFFDDENYIDRHYAVYVEDEKGCVSPVDTLTFDQIQTKVAMVVTSVETTECSETIEIEINGGVGPYTVMVNDSTLTGMSPYTYTMPRGTFLVKGMDSHMCAVEQTIEVIGDMVTRYDTVNTYYGDSTQYVDAVSGIDTMLIAGDYTFMYTDTESGCERELMVNVVEVAWPIAMVQGEDDKSPLEGETTMIAGTVTAVAEGEGFFVQDAVAAWSGIWVEYSDVTTDGIEVGDGVEVMGAVMESSSVTTVVATSVTVIDAPLAITPVDATPTAAKAEMWESVLVKVGGARADTLATGGEWDIYYEDTDRITVNDWLYVYTPKTGDFYDVTGVVNARLDNFRLEPRMESDIENITETTAVDPEFANAFKVYPNPFRNQITIDNNDKLVRVVISNIAGQRVIDVEYPGREIRTQSLVSGVYLVNLFTEEGIVKTERIVKR